MNFDKIIDRRGTHSSKWDLLEPLYGLTAEDGLAMWVADMDFRPPGAIIDAVRARAEHGIFGYYGDHDEYLQAVRWWLDTRHGWSIDPDWVFSTHGLVNGTGMCVDAFTDPGDGVVLFSPVYHVFYKVIKAAGRTVVECPLVEVDGKYQMDFEAYDGLMTGTEKMLILCSPHNPGGRVWTRAELEGVAAFAKRHNLILVSDEIHQDLVLPGYKHTPMALIEGIEDRLVMMSASTKTFNIAGAHIGNVIIPDPDLRARFATRMAALGISGGTMSILMATAAYSPEGADWVDALVQYLDGNRRVFDEGVNAIPGVRSMPLEATYLSWVDFSGTGLSRDDVLARVQKDAKIAPNYGYTFGTGGENCQRFNIGMPRARIEEAVARLQNAFKDLQ